MKVRFISVTPDAEKAMAYIARVSSPKNQDNPDYAKLLAYCIKHGHWSVFEQAHMTVEITTSRAIAAQILRHRSMTFQEHSQRYAEAQGYEFYKARRQDSKNRQNSIDDISTEDQIWFQDAQCRVAELANKLYAEALEKGIAKECSRFLLPLATQTTMFMTGNARSFLHYIDTRTDPATQLEHREIAQAIKSIFIEQFPIISKAKGWIE